jgi:hypothetical protein
MVDCWADHFPPLQHPLRLVIWLAVTHTSEMFAYPIGAEGGASILTSICFGVGLLALWRSRRRELAVTVLGWFGVSLLAAALHRYPYGGHARLSQYLAPGICLLTGLGAAMLAAKLRRFQWRVAAVRSALAFCAILGVATVIRDTFKPYKSVADRNHRDFARRLWNDATGTPAVGLRTELGVTAYDENLNTICRCYQRIYGPVSRGGSESIRERLAAADQPLRCVAYHSASAPCRREVLEDWIQQMQRSYELCGTESHALALTVTSAGLSDVDLVRYDVYYFRPRSGGLLSDRGGAVVR